MTGFGKATLQLPNKKITVEIKSLNSKSLDLNVRTPYVYREMELALRNQIAQKLERGKVDFSLFIEISKSKNIISLWSYSYQSIDNRVFDQLLFKCLMISHSHVDAVPTSTNKNKNWKNQFLIIV